MEIETPPLDESNVTRAKTNTPPAESESTADRAARLRAAGLSEDEIARFAPGGQTL